MDLQLGLTSVILVDLLGLEKLTNAFGLLLLFQGVASFGKNNFAIITILLQVGCMTVSYGPAFIMAGVMIAISGLVMLAIPPIKVKLWAKLLEMSFNSVSNNNCHFFEAPIMGVKERENKISKENMYQATVESSRGIDAACKITVQESSSRTCNQKSHKKKGFFKQFWKKSKHYSLEQ